MNSCTAKECMCVEGTLCVCECGDGVCLCRGIVGIEY